MVMHVQRRIAAFAIVSASLSCVAEPALAQLEEIVVTTRRRAESLQEVPIVVTTFGAEAIQRKGIGELGDLTKYTSGLILDNAYSKQDSRIIIRGLSPTRGRQNVAVLQDDVDISTTAILSAGGGFSINPRLFDTERVEIVKGPHSALYGRQAFNGAINYITKKPGNKFEGTAGVEIGSYDKYEGRVGVSGPILEGKVSMGLNAAGWTQGGFYKSAVSGGKLGGGDGRGVAGSIVVTPNDVFKVFLRSEYSDDHFDPEPRVDKFPSVATPTPSTAVGWVAGATPTVAINAGSAGSFSDYGVLRPSRNPDDGKDYPGYGRQIWRTTLRGEATFEDISVISLFHYGLTKQQSWIDQFAEGDAADLAVNAIQELHSLDRNQLLSEDLRVQSNGTGPLNWTVGGLYWYENSHQDNLSLNCIATSGGCASILRQIGSTLPYFVPPYTTDRKTHHYSVYALADFAITDELSISGEIRHTWERESINGPTTQTGFIGCPVTGVRVVQAGTGLIVCQFPGAASLALAATGYVNPRTPSKFWTPRVTVSYKVAPDALLYASAAEGKKPGGVSLVGTGVSAATNTYDPEKMWVYEIGAKTEWLDKRLLVNVAGYYQDYSKKQLTGTIISPVDNIARAYTANASSARVWGLDLETIAAISPNFTANLSYTYLDTKYTAFRILNSTLYNIVRAGNCERTTVQTAPPPAAATNQCYNTFSGNQLEGAPKHSLTGGVQYRATLSGDIDWLAEADIKYQSKRFIDYYNQLYLNSYWNIDVRAGVTTSRWNVVAYVNNVFDDDTLKTGANDFPDFNRSLIGSFSLGYVAQFNAPDKRQVGVRAGYRF